jgi:hypothetical protein
MRPVGLIGDVHGIPDELKELVDWFIGQGLKHSDIWVLGDLVDRGPDSGAVVRFCRSTGIRSIKGNHEQSIINRWNGLKAGNKFRHVNPDKEKTISQLTQEDIDWMTALPPIHVFDDNKLVIAHGGLWPRLPFHKQPINVIRAQLIQPWNPGPSKWWGPKCEEVNGVDEAGMYANGWIRWYEAYDHQYDVAFGHSVFQSPMIYKKPGSGTVFGLDQGGVFGGWLTGMIHRGPGDYHIKQIKAKKVYCVDLLKQFGE